MGNHLSQQTRLKKFLESKEDGFFYPGHASALVRIGGLLGLFDPLWGPYKPYSDYWEFRPEQFDCDKILDRVSFCVVSHIHADHVCEPILNKLQCSILFMEGRPNLRDRLTEITPLCYEYAPFQWVQRWNAIEFYFVPHAFNSIDSSCFVRSQETGYCVYVGSDNFLSPELIAKVLPDVPRVDIAMVPYAFIHWWPFLMEMNETEKRKQILRMNKQSLDQAQEFVAAFKPKHVVPFGASLFHAQNESLNHDLSKPEDFIGAHPMHAGSSIIGDQVDIAPIQPARNYFIELIAKVTRASKKVPGHQLVVNGLRIDLGELTVDFSNPKPPYIKFTFKNLEYQKWFRGEITFEEAIGTRQFTCKRVPDIYDARVFDWFNNFI